MSTRPLTFTDVDALSLGDLYRALERWGLNTKGSRSELVFRVMCALAEAGLLDGEDVELLSHRDFYRLVTDLKYLKGVAHSITSTVNKETGSSIRMSRIHLTKAEWIYVILRTNARHLYESDEYSYIRRIIPTINGHAGFKSMLTTGVSTDERVGLVNARHSYHAEMIRGVYPFVGRLVTRDCSGYLEVSSTARTSVDAHIAESADKEDAASRIVSQIERINSLTMSIGLYVINIDVDHTRIDAEGNLWITNVSKVTNYREKDRRVWDVQALISRPTYRSSGVHEGELLTPDIDPYLNAPSVEGQAVSPW